MTQFRVNREYTSRNDSEDKHDFRTEFERDRDRILYSKTFRRLAGKTQIFLSSSHDHVRNRMTHTFEVAQIARTIARVLLMDDALTEAIALGHDMGHTPFGHVGEQALDYIMNRCDQVYPFYYRISDKDKGFKHNLQGIKMASTMAYKSFYGLNLSNYTLWGIANHTSLTYKDINNCKHNIDGKCYEGRKDTTCLNNGVRSLQFYEKFLQLTKLSNRLDIDNAPEAWSFEGLIVAIADEIAQRHHDIEDGLLSKLITPDELIGIFDEKFSDTLHTKSTKIAYLEMKNNCSNKNFHIFLPYVSKFIVDYLVTDVVLHSKEMFEKFADIHNINNRADFRKQYPMIEKSAYKDVITFSEEVL